MEAGKACLVSNSDSGANLRHGLAGVESVAAGAGLRHRRVDDVEMLPGVLEDCARDGVEYLVINAGDGTVCRVLEIVRTRHTFPREPVLVLLRGGTTNMIHNDVGLPGRPETALRRLLNATAAPRYIERHVLRVELSARAHPCFGFFFGTNAVPRAIRRTRQRLHGRVSTGRLSEVLSVVAMIWRLLRRRVETDPVLAPVSLELCRDGGEWRRQSNIMLLALTVRKALLGVRPLRAGQRAGMAVLSWPGYRLLPWLGTLLRGGLDDFRTIGLRGEFEWVLDGEMYRHGPSDGDLQIALDAPARFLQVS